MRRLIEKRQDRRWWRRARIRDKRRHDARIGGFVEFGPMLVGSLRVVVGDQFYELRSGQRLELYSRGFSPESRARRGQPPRIVPTDFRGGIRSVGGGTAIGPAVFDFDGKVAEQ